MSGDPRTAMEWLEDFQDCLAGDFGPEWHERADEWMEANVDSLPTDGTSWKAWREFRQATRGGVA